MSDERFRNADYGPYNTEVHVSASDDFGIVRETHGRSLSWLAGDKLPDPVETWTREHDAALARIEAREALWREEGDVILRNLRAAEARVEELQQRLHVSSERAVELQRERDELATVLQRKIVGVAPVDLDLLSRVGVLQTALREIKSELGVPDENYPAPVANAVDIADRALDGETLTEAARGTGLTGGNAE